ncbi:MAG: redoxin domain-containing protein [Rhodospirillales bacterium]|nr:redoxin domain-containing protein [Rhodospirillales bacterium]
MALLEAGICDFGWKAKDFGLKGTDGKTYTLADVRGPKGLLVMFICNHCPYVKAIQERMVRDAKELMKAGIGVVAINANGAESQFHPGPVRPSGDSRGPGFQPPTASRPYH